MYKIGNEEVIDGINNSFEQGHLWTDIYTLSDPQVDWDSQASTETEDSVRDTEILFQVKKGIPTAQFKPRLAEIVAQPRMLSSLLNEVFSFDDVLVIATLMKKRRTCLFHSPGFKQWCMQNIIEEHSSRQVTLLKSRATNIKGGIKKML